MDHQSTRVVEQSRVSTQQAAFSNWVTGVINKPSADSFIPFFREWFKNEWYPEIAEAMHQRLDQRFREESRQSILGTLRTAAASMLMQTTREMHCELACTAILSRSGVTYRDFNVCVWAELVIDGDRNSSRSRDRRSKKLTKVHFVGINGTWHALPRWLNSGLNFDLEGLIADVARGITNEIHGTKSDNSGKESESGVKRKQKRNRKKAR